MTSNYYNPADPNLIYIQSRAEVDPALIEEYAEAMAAGAQFPALKAVGKQHTLYIYDGYHRGEAAKKTGLPLCISVKPGTRAEAEWLALAANQEHGLRRSNADKQKIVRLALAHDFGAKLSDRQLAAHCGVSDKTVGKIRAELVATAEIPQSATRLGADGREINVGNIGGQPKREIANYPDGFPEPRPVLGPEKNTDTANPSWRCITQTAEACYLCGNEAIYHNNGWRDQPGADFHLCHKHHTRHQDAVTGFTDAAQLQAALDQLKQSDIDDAPRGRACPHCGMAAVQAADGSLKCINVDCDSWWENLVAYEAAANGFQSDQAETPPPPAESCSSCGRPGRFDTYGTGRRICFQCWIRSPEHKAGGAPQADRQEPEYGPATEASATYADGEAYPKPTEPDTASELRLQLGRALQADSDRWVKHRQTGLSNADLVEQIGDKFGLGGGASGPGNTGYWCSGGKNPRFWLGYMGYHSRPPTLAGAALRDAARELLGIPFPDEADSRLPTPDPSYTLRSDLTYRCQRAGIRFGALLDKIKTTDQADRLDQALAGLEKEFSQVALAEPIQK